MRLVSFVVTVFALLVSFVSCVQFEYSQFRSEEENQKRFAEVFYKSIQTCDGREREAHEACVSSVREELIARFDDRNKAFMRKEQVVAMLTTQLIIQYKIDKSKKANSRQRQAQKKSSASSSGRAAELAFEGNENLAISDTIRTTGGRACRATSFSFSFAMGNVVPIVCN
jgi:hypothetical protein